jgi:nucleoid-associated protein YgaU
VSTLGNFDFSAIPKPAWIVIVGGGLAYGYYRYRNGASTPAVTEGDPNADPNAAAALNAVGNGAVGGYVDNSTPAPTSNAITDNASWGRAATNELIAEGYDPAVSDSAVRKYLASASLSVSEYALIKVVLLKFGTPPEALPNLPAAPPTTPVAPPPQAPPPVSPPPPPPPAPAAAPAHVYYTVVPGDSLSKIAARYPQAWITWQSIYNNNRGQISNPNLIHPGQVLLIY